MKEKILRSAMIAAAVLLTASEVHALSSQLAPGTQIQLKTSRMGNQIVGVTSDGVFTAIICGSATQADLLFPNSAGDVVTERYNSSVPRLSAWAPERSSYIGLTSAAAQQVCANPDANYVFRAVSEGDVEKLEVASFVKETRSLEAPQAGQKVQVRTGQVGKKIAAVTNDGKFFAIMCDQGMILQSTADLIYPNSNGKIVIHDYQSKGVRVSLAPAERAAYLPLTTRAVLEVCNFPNGIYSLQVNADDGETRVDYVSGQRFEAKSLLRSRGF